MNKHRDLWEEAVNQVEEERKRDNMTFFLLLAAVILPIIVAVTFGGFG